MIPRIVIICFVAIIFYVIFPALSRWIEKNIHLKTLKRFKRETTVTGKLWTLKENRLSIKTDNEIEKEVPVIPKKTRFFMMNETKDFSQIPWSTVFLVQTGTPVYWSEAKNRWEKNQCLFYSPSISKSIDTDLENAQAISGVKDSAKKWFVATGAFIEFLLLLESIQTNNFNGASIAAIIAIFGKALPYCPPGLFFTLGAYYISKKGEDTKKNRQRKVAGFLLASLGVAINIVVLFIIIRDIGFSGI